MTDAAALLLQIFANDLLPVFAIAGAGFLVARFAGVQVQSVSRLTFQVLAPALVFNVLLSSTLDAAQSGRMVLFYVLVTLSAAVLARLAAIPLQLDRRMLSAFMLVAISSNSGNYGLPVTLLAFGRDALAFAEPLGVLMKHHHVPLVEVNPVPPFPFRQVGVPQCHEAVFVFPQPLALFQRLTNLLRDPLPFKMCRRDDQRGFVVEDRLDVVVRQRVIALVVRDFANPAHAVE